MKIFSAKQIRDWDNYTIQNEPVSGIDLMERAALECVKWLCINYPDSSEIIIICGRGNNGGDGLAIGRLLITKGFFVKLFVLDGQKYGSANFESNLSRYKDFAEVFYIKSIEELPIIPPGRFVIDAILGTGLTKPVEGLAKSIIEYLNASSGVIISVDVPSGLFSDTFSSNIPIIRATHTLTFQQVKFSFLLPESKGYTGKVHVLNIGLSKDYYSQTDTPFEYIDDHYITTIYKKRDPNGHKGTYGHALIIAGCYGMMGAAVLSVKACLRSGTGKVSALVPKIGYKIMQISVPEAMAIVSGKRTIGELESVIGYDAIGVGPGLGRIENYKEILSQLFTEFKRPLAIDADALYQIGTTPELLETIPPNSILTPHLKEFAQLFGDLENGLMALEMALEKSKLHNIIIVLKGHHTFIACPDGKGYFNSTGNSGMATGGSGDVLTGIITGLLAQGYSPNEAAIMGVFIHGKAGDLGAQEISEEALIAGDIINYLGKAFLQIPK